MKKKLLLLAAISLFGYQLVQSHTWTIHNNTHAKIEVTVKITRDQLKDTITKTIPSNGTEIFYKEGFCFENEENGTIFVDGIKIPESKFYGPKQKAPTGKYRCSSQNIQINRNAVGNWYWQVK